MPGNRTSNCTSSSRRSSSNLRTFSSDFRLDALRQGDRIQVFSAGTQIDGNGTFIRVRDGFLL
ncbi:hypothetical protein ACRBU7_27230 (plasmid) [Priestia aryabhattai]|uniref:hypothetical protein n=1 Tax=Priestia aryabhattai TaxID=412384 RepID=UPI003D7FBE80